MDEGVPGVPEFVEPPPPPPEPPAVSETLKEEVKQENIAELTKKNLAEAKNDKIEEKAEEL